MDENTVNVLGLWIMRVVLCIGFIAAGFYGKDELVGILLTVLIITFFYH